MFDDVDGLLEELRRSIAAIESGLLDYCGYVEFLQDLFVVMVALTIALPFVRILMDRVWCWGRHNLTRAIRLSWVVATLVTLAYAPLTARPVREFEEAIEPAVELFLDMAFGSKRRSEFFDKNEEALGVLAEVVLERSPGLSCLERAANRKPWQQLGGAPAVAWMGITDGRWMESVLVRSGLTESDFERISAAMGGSVDLTVLLQEEPFREITIRGISTGVATVCLADSKAPASLGVVTLLFVWCATSTLWLSLSLLFTYVWLRPRTEDKTT